MLLEADLKDADWEDVPLETRNMFLDNICVK